MAKRKRGTALFEVMSQHKAAVLARSDPASPAPRGGGIPTPKWWFKSKPRGDVRTLAPGETLVDAPPARARHNDEVDDDDHVENTTAATAAPEEQPPSTTRVVPLSSSLDMADADGSSRPQPVSVSVDPDRQLINLRLSYMSALIGGFGLFIVVGVAILIGKSFSRGPTPAIADTTTQSLKQGPPMPGVLNVPRRPDGALNDAIENPAARAGGQSPGARGAQSSAADPRPPSTFYTDDPRRQNGLNYAIIQSYPDKDTADKAAEFLTKNGIACTVERNLPNWKLHNWPDGCVVVGIRGFTKVSNNPALDAYQKSIMDVSTKFVNSGRSRFMAFKPSMYLWRKPN